ncbi:Vanillate O-demethylase oxidoreductase [Pseudomonas reidholzensis]|uniref:Vanillate O-demethylase oxidoreductase n=1 Tax=Pseudomonas reidholzensis TaxID=1785162 RepID=A0A383RYG2_9PSED|nr:PDR/VanB family oxidoreductase [Pseudomonas reidholzensis]SYX91803.1 Vanillate O-demethylase oxidoreductase [Pseudomonas reidholzensis]
MLQVNVIRKAKEAEGICSFELAAADGRALPAFGAGAHIDVHIAEGLTRRYSLCNDPQERHRYLISVLKDPGSRGGSVAMHEQVQEGQALSISAPRNLFALDPGAARHLLFGGGIGITPILAMAYELFNRGAAFELHYCFRSTDRAAFLPMLRLAPFADCIVLHDDSGAQAQKLDAHHLLATPAPGTHLYVCGPGGFMTYLLDAAQQAGWADACVHREFFAATAVDPASNLAFEVQLASSGRVFSIPADRTVFEVLDEAGIDIQSSCEQGVCGTCVTRVLEGLPDHRDQFLTTAEHAANDRFTPCCSRARSQRLVLDL